jgi:spore germination protein YaaH
MSTRTRTHSHRRSVSMIAAAVLATALAGVAAAAGPLPVVPRLAAVPAATAPAAPLVAAPVRRQDVPHDAARFGYAEKGMRGEVLAFFRASEIAYVRDRADLGAVSTLAYFGLQAGADGHLKQNAGMKSWNSAAMARILERAHTAGAKLVASIVRFSWNAKDAAVTKKLLASPDARQLLAGEIAQAVAARGADGVNLDFEPIPSGQRANYTDLVRRVRTALDGVRPGLQLTAAITGYFSSYGVAGLVGPGGADALYLMGYHYAGTWTKYARSTSPMGGRWYDIADTIRALRRAGVRPEQLIVGIPYYAHVWPVANGKVHARTTGPGRDMDVAEALALVAKHGARWDTAEQATWTAWKSGGKWQELFVDDPRTLASKWARFQNMGLLGTGMWTIGKEHAPGVINGALRQSWLVAP